MLVIIDEFKTLVKSIKDIQKNFNTGIRDLNDCAVSLRKLSEAADESVKIEKFKNGLQKAKDDDYWHSIFKGEGSERGLPGEKYDWVLVKIRDHPDLCKGSICQIYNLPHIAEFRSDGNWWPLEWEDHYGTEKVPFEVIYWRPIPGDSQITLCNGAGQTLRRDHIYE